MNNLKKSVVVVLGMHRSGTSVITRGLEVLGISLGDNLMPPIKNNNDKGFFEDVDINALNMKMLKAIGSDWNCLRPIENKDLQCLNDNLFQAEALELLQKKMANSHFFGFKDPRVAKLLPFWNQVVSSLPINLYYIIALRHPLSVVKSLVKRDGIKPEQAYWLWLGYVLESIRGINSKHWVIVDYDNLMRAPEKQIHRVATTLGIDIDPVRMNFFKNIFLDNKLRHTKYTNIDLLNDDSCPPLICEVYDLLLCVSEDKINVDDNFLAKEIEKWLNEFNRLKTILKLFDEENQNGINLNRVVADKESQLGHLHELVADKESQLGHLHELVEDKESQLANLRQILESVFLSRSWRITKPLRCFISFFKSKRF